MNSMKLFSLGVFITGALLFSSCKKEGCTNPNADNFNAEANISDKSCLFSTDIIFWFKEAESNALTNDGIDQADFYLNDELLGNASTYQFWDEEPDCENDTLIRFTKELTKSNSEPFYYFVKDSEGDTLYSGITTLTTESCTMEELEGY